MNKPITALIIGLSALSLTACAEVTQEDVGHVTGGVIGGVLGSHIGHGRGRAVATIAGAVIGSHIGGQVGRSMDKLDRLEMQHALESARTGSESRWSNPDTGNVYTVKPTRTYYRQARNDQPCREYITKAKIGGKMQQIYGTACRQADGSWQVIK